MVPVPVGILDAAARLAGQHAVFMQLCGSLLLDSEETRRELGWTPSVSFVDGIRRTVAWYVSDGPRPGHGAASD